MSAARHLRAAPDPAVILREDIRELCRQIDMRLGHRPGTAERGCFFWYWPPDEITDPVVLARLHADAATFLATITAEAAQ